MTTTDVLGYIQTTDGMKYFLFGNGFTDGAETELKTYDDGGKTRSLGDAIENKVLEEIGLQVTDGSVMDSCKIKDPQGGVVHSFVGNERPTRDALWNLRVTELTQPIEKSHKLYVTTGD